MTDASPPAPARPRARRRALRWSLLGLLALVLSSCTLTSGKHMEVDFLAVRYRFYIYEKPTSQIAVELRSHCRTKAGTARKDWARCSLAYLQDEVDVPSVGDHDWGVFTGLDQWDDYGGAVDAVISTGFSYDGSGERYAHACLVGDHSGFGDYNWTTRPADDGHCKRGVNAS